MRNFHIPSYTCVLCAGSILETYVHLFFECPFVRALLVLYFLCIEFLSQMDIHSNFQTIRQLLEVPFHMEIATLVSQSIWKIWNDCIFQGTCLAGLYRCKKIFKEELNLVFHRTKRKSYSNFRGWIDAFRQSFYLSLELPLYTHFYLIQYICSTQAICLMFSPKKKWHRYTKSQNELTDLDVKTSLHKDTKVH